jgi:1,4-dihydroxy-2-naphthoate octaprenyltransferase
MTDIFVGIYTQLLVPIIATIVASILNGFLPWWLAVLVTIPLVIKAVRLGDQQGEISQYRNSDEIYARSIMIFVIIASIFTYFEIAL